MTRLFALLLSLLPLAAPAQAEGTVLPLIAEAERGDWAGVGRVNRGGFKTTRLCSGALVAPDLVLTAAHCVDGENRIIDGVIPDLFFVAGWDRGEYAAVGRVAEVIAHPLGRPAGDYGLRHDIALLRLSEPITGIAPLPLDMSGLLHDSYAIVGYQRARPHVLTGGFACGRAAAPPGLLSLDCPVRGGHSGAPVLVRRGDGWAVAGVTVARQGARAALAVRLGAWVLSRVPVPVSGD